MADYSLIATYLDTFFRSRYRAFISTQRRIDCLIIKRNKRAQFNKFTQTWNFGKRAPSCIKYPNTFCDIVWIGNSKRWASIDNKSDSCIQTD